MRWLRNTLGLTGLAVLSLAVTACEENESVLFIVGVLSVQDSSCVARPEQDAPILSGGILDLSIRSGYRAALLVGSHLTQRASREQLRTETARFALQGAEVTLTDIAGKRLSIGNPNPYSTIGTGFVNPSGGTDAGYGVMFVDLVPAGLQVEDSTIISKVRVFGKTLGGAELESNEYIFPITICRGCLIQYPTGSADDTMGDGSSYLCRTASAESEEITNCFPGQDSLVPCTFCSAFNGACRDPCQNCSVRTQSSLCAGTQPPPDCAN